METLKHAWDFIWSQPEGRWSLGAILTFILIRELLRSLTNKIPNDAGRRGGEWLARVLSATARAISKLRRERLDGAYSSREEPRQRTQSAKSDEPDSFDFDPYVVLGVSRNAS